MRHKFALWLPLGFALSVGFAYSQQLVCQPVNPSFGGYANNTTHLFATANAQNTAKIGGNIGCGTGSVDGSGGSGNSLADLFVRQLQNRLIYFLVDQVSKAIYPEEGDEVPSAGTVNFGDQQITYIRGDGVINLQIIDNSTGAETDISLPTFQSARINKIQVIVMIKQTLLITMALSLSACGAVSRMVFSPGPQLATVTEQAIKLKMLPPPKQPIYADVYSYQDLTGQYKPSDKVQTLSRSVTQGADTMLVRALQDAGDRSWFRVVERGNLDGLLKERQIVTQIRKICLGEDKVDPKVLPPLLYAGVLFEGGVVGYDSNTRTGGVGARYLGIGGNADYRQDDVTVSLRAVSTRTGEVMANVMVQKSVVSVGIKGGAFRYIALDEILEAEAGITKNEPVTLAGQQAIDKAVYSIIMEGARVGAWGFANPAQANSLYQEYTSETAQVTHTVKSNVPPPPSNTGPHRCNVPLARANLWANKKS